jgi:molecular chaperone DnaK
MGCRWDEISDRREGVSYRVGPDEQGMVAVQFDARRLRPAEVSAQVLLKMKRTAEAYLGEAVRDAVITAPAHFNDSQRQATKSAAEMAGINCLRIINEPTAAALAYGLNRRERQTVAIFDFGGGTFDISILEIDGDVFEVKSTGGDTYLGGDNIDQVVAEWICRRIQSETGIDPADDLRAMQRIAETAEKVKCELSSLNKTLVALPFIVSDASGPKHFSSEISREEFNALIVPMLERLVTPCEQALRDAGVTAEKLGSVVLVGGSTRIPAVRELVKKVFKRSPDSSINPDEVVACGAAIQAGILSGALEELLLLDVAPLSLGIELANDVFSTIIPRNSNIPTTVRKRFTTVRDNQSNVRVHVLQGERKMASANRSLARFKLEDIAPAPKEIPEIEVSFHIDANGILTVSAEDITSGASTRVEIESYRPSDDAGVHQAVEAAAGHVDQDRVFSQKIVVRRRMDEMESHVDSIRERIDGGAFSEDLERRAREAFFKLRVALAQSQWDLIEEAERNAKSVFVEITSLAAMRASKKAGDASMLDLTNEPGGRRRSGEPLRLDD